MSGSTPTKQVVAPAAAKPVTAFGIEVAPSKNSAMALAIDKEAQQKKKRLIMAGTLIVHAPLLTPGKI